MAVESFVSVGINKLLCARPYDSSIFNISGGYKYYASTYDILTVSRTGTDIAPILKAALINVNITLAKFKDNSEIYCKKLYSVDGNRQGWGDFDYWMWYYYIEVYYKSPNGTSTKISTSNQWWFASEYNGSIVTHPIYLCFAIDEETKCGYFGKINGMVKSKNEFTSRNGQPTQIDYDTMYRDFSSDWNFMGTSFMYNILVGNGNFYDSDPWAKGDYADIGGGDGELDLTSDIIDLPSLPTSFSETGFVQVFCPTLAQVKELSSYMWSSNFFDNFLKLFNDPMDIIISLSMLPFSINPTGSRLVYAGNVVTTVSMNYTSEQYAVIECGSLQIKPFYDAYIDYDPYTTCQIFLPYIGYQALSMDDIMGKTIKVTYRVDLMTGVCAAYITCNNVLLYTFTGSCSASIPVSGQSYTSIAQSVINIATATTLSAKPTKGVTAGANATKGAAGSLASNVLSMKPDISRSGNVSANIGILGAQKPYLVFSVPRTCLPKGQNKYLGYPSFMSTKLSLLTGYTEVQEIRLNNMTCTEAEQAEIIEILKGGVIL